MTTNDWSVNGRRRTDRHQARKRTRSKKKKKSVSLLPLFIVGILLFSVYAGFQITERFLGGAFDHIGTGGSGDKNPALSPKNDKDKKKAKDYLTVLLIGTDQRRNEAARADALILAVFNKTDKELKLVSLPRDSRVNIPGRGTEKLNHAHAYGGANLSVMTAEEMLGIEIDSYIETNFRGFANMVDIIGGIEMEVERNMYYYDSADGTLIDLKKGHQTLDGDQALQYVRYRSDGRGDMGRIERQQKFLKTLADQMLQVINVLRIPSLVGELNKNIKTDMGVSDMISLATLLKDIDLSDLDTTTLPGEPIWVRGTNYYELDRQGIKEMMQTIIPE